MANLDFLNEIEDIEFFPDKDLSNFSTLKLKSHGNFVLVKTVNALRQLLKKCNEKEIHYSILGWGANLLLPKQIESLCLKLDFEFDKKYLSELREVYVLPGSVALNQLTACAIKFGLKGWEVFTGIPASLAGAVFMNAGTNLGEIGELVEEVKLVNSQGELRILSKDDLKFSYRKNHFVNDGDIIVEVSLSHKGQSEEIGPLIKDYLKKRSQNQPLDKRTCGCVYKNPVYANASCHAGQIIDIIGLKGLTLGDLRVSTVHGNFIENFGEADLETMLPLIEAIQEEVKLQLGIDLETEVRRFED
jgi:UDP-N-acetylmuramate dehydrogenase